MRLLTYIVILIALALGVANLVASCAQSLTQQVASL